MPKRRRSSRIAWETVLGILFVANIFAGLYASRLTSLIKIRVEGAMPEDKARIRAILERTHSKPALQLNRRATESAILSKGEVLSAEMTRNIFGRALVKVKYREPVAAIKGMANRVLAIDGVVFDTHRNVSGLPTFSMPEIARAPAIGIVGPWRSRDVGWLAAAVRGIAGEEPVEIQSTDDGGLCLNIGSKFAVDLGLPEDLAAKVDRLRKKLDDEPALISSGKTLVLVSLENASLRDGVNRNRR